MFSNSMGRLIEKTEHVLEVSFIMPFVPDQIKKDTWAKVIKENSIRTFSRYIPNKMSYMLDTSRMDRDGYYYIDEKIIPADIEIIGIRDMDWEQLSIDGGPYSSLGPYSVDYVSGSFDMEDLCDIMMSKHANSLFNQGMYLDFKAPNKVKVISPTRNPVHFTRPLPIEIFFTHPDNLQTIHATQMETLEPIVYTDIAKHLYAVLKYLDHLETSYGTIELKIEKVEEWNNKWEDVRKELEEKFVSAGNKNIPLVMTI